MPTVINVLQRLDPREVLRLVDRTLSQAAIAASTATFARLRLEEAKAINERALGHAPPFKTRVDGRPGASLESVKPGGVVEIEFELINDVLLWIKSTLVERSPRLKGEYIAGQKLFADGREIVAGERILEAEQYIFTNAVPYARKIEIGKTQAGRPFVIQVENRIYERTAQDAQARFGNIAKISFTYQDIIGGKLVSRRSSNSASIRYPAIIVKP